MEKFQELILKMAETNSPNTPLTPSAKTYVKNRLNEVFSQYERPDHPPYSAMIEKAIREMNEQGGSNEESISEFLQREYKGLPFAHSTLLKHHLGKLCESGDIIMTLDKKYMLVEVNPSRNSCSESTMKLNGLRKRKDNITLFKER